MTGTEQRMTTVDPGWYTDAASVQRADTETLKRVYTEARRVYFDCGGHGTAARMQIVQNLIEIELHEREGIEPNPYYDDYRVVSWQPVA
jgi:hypothetical protein